MAEWCDTEYFVAGNNQNLLRRFWLDANLAISGNGLPVPGPVDWLGNIYIQAGYEYDAVAEEFVNNYWIECAGTVQEITMEKEEDGRIKGIKIWAQTKWQPLIESFQRLINEKYPGLDLYVKAEELVGGITINTDKSHVYFPEKWLVRTDVDYFYFSSDQAKEFVFFVSSLAGVEFEDVEDVFKSTALITKEYKERAHTNQEDAYIEIYEFKEN